MVKGKIFLRILANSLLGAVLIFLWTRFINLEEVGKILKTAEVKFALLFFIFFLVSATLRSFRFKLLLKNYCLPFKDAFMLNSLSQFLSFLIPIRAGEITKSAYLTAQFDLSLSKSIILVLVDRFLDFWAVLLLISLLLLFVSAGLTINITRIIFILFILFSLIFAGMVASERIFKGLTSRVSRYLVVEGVKRRFLSLSHSIIEGFGILRRSKQEFAALIVLTITATVFDSLIWLAIFLSVGVNLGFAKAVLGNCLAALTFLVPAAPGYVGSAEAAALAVFAGILKQDANLVSAASVLYHVLTIVIVMTLGMVAIYLLKFDLGSVWKKLRRQ